MSNTCVQVADNSLAGLWTALQLSHNQFAGSFFVRINATLCAALADTIPVVMPRIILIFSSVSVRFFTPSTAPTIPTTNFNLTLSN
jgi:hypothetical protein